MILTNTRLMIILCALLPACAPIDNYVLGKDNTPKPEKLAPIHSKVALTEHWSIPVGSAVTAANAYLKLKPSIHSQIIYTASTGGMVEAIDKNTAKVIWSKQLPEGVVSGPTVQNGYVILGTNRSSVVALKESDGSEVWKTSVSGDVLSKPVIAGKKVLAKTIDGNLYALELETGKQAWISDHGTPHLILKASASPVILGNIALVGFSDGRLNAVDIESGHTVWERGIAYATGASDVERLVDIDADPLIQNNIAYLGSYQGYVGALSLNDGQFLWQQPASIYKNMVMDNDALYFTDSEDVIWAVNKQNGQIKWKQVSLKARGLTEPVLLGKKLIVGDKTGVLHILARKNGELIGRKQLDAPIVSPPEVTGNQIYVMTTNSKLNYLSVA